MDEDFVELDLTRNLNRFSWLVYDTMHLHPAYLSMRGHRAFCPAWLSPLLVFWFAGPVDHAENPNEALDKLLCAAEEISPEDRHHFLLECYMVFENW